MLWKIVALVLMGLVFAPAGAKAQHVARSTALVLDNLTVIDVQQGKRLSKQRVVIVGNRIKTMGNRNAVRIPNGAHVVNARGKYLIPGLWDMHIHLMSSVDVLYPLFVVNGVTGIRDAGPIFSLETLRSQHQEVLAGTRVGPPRQILSGPQISDSIGYSLAAAYAAFGIPAPQECEKDANRICVHDLADARHVVDSLKAAGSNMLKMYGLGKEAYFAIAAEARRVGIPFGGHLGTSRPSREVSAVEASDSGASIIDHILSSGGLDTLCLGSIGTIARCQPVAERFRRNGTWWVPTIIIEAGLLRPKKRYTTYADRATQLADTFHSGIPLSRAWLRAAAAIKPVPRTVSSDSLTQVTDYLDVAHRVGLPILAGSDFTGNPLVMVGLSLHTELAAYVMEGLTPLEALQTATLNPAKMLHATDSLGTVASGKLADLVLLDADPLKDIANTTAIWAVIANGRYFDRVALDRLLAAARTAP